MTEVQLDSEYLPARGEARQNLVLLHGWSSSSEVWRPLLAHVRNWANVTLVDLPGCSSRVYAEKRVEVATLTQAILDLAPEKAVYLGWSLGGQVASYLAQSAPDRVAALVTLCSNPRFVAEGDWPGVSNDVFSAFRGEAGSDIKAAIHRFDSLQSRGSLRPRAVRRTLAATRKGVDQLGLHASLDLLAELDVRAALQQLTHPQLHIFAQRDGLVPTEVAEALAGLIPDKPGVKIRSIADASHGAPVESATEIEREIFDFLLAAGLLQEAGNGRDQPVKADVAESFSRAAAHYDSAAHLQREVGARLLEKLTVTALDPQCILDLGCGTGHFQPLLMKAFPDASYLGLDLAPGMVDYARSRSAGAAGWMVGDAEYLPLASDSKDLIFSSLAVQWCDNPSRLFAELGRVLRPGGRCVFTSLGPSTLKELRSAWAAVDGHQHVNTFLSCEELRAGASKLTGISLQLHRELFSMEYDKVGELLGELKTIGAHNMNRGRPTGLTSRRALQGMLRAYESWRDEHGKLPASYEVLFGVLERA
jgi:malonyl-CoA O-methyltransferase